MIDLQGFTLLIDYNCELVCRKILQLDLYVVLFIKV
jgi:hypothetical protein